MSHQFDKADTRSESFTLPDGSKADVPMMHGQLAAQVTQTPQYDAVPIPANGQVNVTVVVPTGDQTPESIVPLLEERDLGSLGDQTHLRQRLRSRCRASRRASATASGKRCKRWA